jgi:heat shock protein HtpX
MMNALARLDGLAPGELPKTVLAMGTTGAQSGLMALFSSHPPIEQRIAALQTQR